MKKIWWVIILAMLFTLTFCVTCRLFDSAFAEASIDWLSFSTGIFLAVEGIYKLRKFKDPFFPGGLMRVFRITIGSCIFTIHLIQFTCGVDCAALASSLTQAAMDWSALIFGIFLATEGTCRIFTARAPLMRDQITRTLRAMIGVCIFTIHVLQFMR